MTFHAQFDRLRAFLLNLECLDLAARHDAFMNEAIETGGCCLPPQANTWSSHLFEIDLHGVTACGMTENEAIRNWTRAARAQVPLGDDETGAAADLPFPAPRNHAEEIANARAMQAASR